VSAVDPFPGADFSPERQRLHRAVVDLLDDRDYEAITVELILDRAAVDRAEFDRHFDDLEDAAIQTYDAIAAGVELRVLGAFEREGGWRRGTWRDGLRAAAYEIMRFFRDNPRDGRFGAYELLKASEMARVRREATLHDYAAIIDAGRRELDDPDSVSPAAAEAVMGSIIGAIVKRIPTEGLDNAPDWVPELMYIAVRPYLGHEIAREELSIPPPPEQSGGYA
jgi:AcrR family transcriptional regulator